MAGQGVDVEVRLPQWGMGMQEGTVLRWLKREGETVQQGEPIAEVEAAKVTEEVEAPASGRLARILVAEGTTVPVRELLAVIATDGRAGAEQVRAEQAEAAKPEPTEAAVTWAGAGRTRASKASPRTRRLAQRLGVELGRLQGSGPDGLVTEADVRGAAERLHAPGPSVVPLTGMRSTIARRMHESLRTMAQVTLTSQADVTELVELRTTLAGSFDVTYTDFVVKAVAVALTEHRRLNARLEGSEIHLLPEVHVGLAVALDDGLIVPVVRDADRKPLRHIAQELKELAQRARRGSLDPGQAAGSTFTITNLGTYGIDAFTPIINPPEAAALGVGRITDKPVRNDDRLEWRRAMGLSLTFDHRLVDGAPAAAFLQAVRDRLEEPQTLTT